ncbi:IclR family transcriptional regulator [Hydrogenophaga sp. BPS33]|uniref:IclR family transcriptional regulator n=1 Tax=Hydrogenophaga sp. BPS33 TaxID=2651974 RepID=UPI00135CB9EE|nr:IclR family transcriptional regulator [Hydrogenophaga sp. BPS33]
MVEQTPSLSGEEGSNVKSALRVLKVLEFFAQTRKPATAADLRRHLDLPKSSCSALMETLRRAGFLYPVGRESGYYPTRRWLELAHAVSENDPVLQALEPMLEEVRDGSGETVILSKMMDQQVLYLDVVECTHEVRIAARSGELKPLYASAAGRALLSTLPDEERAVLIKSLDYKPYTSATSKGPAELEARIQAGLAQGWFLAIGEHRDDTISLSMPLQLGSQHYAVTIGIPRYRMDTKLEQSRLVLGKAVQAFQRQHQGKV